MKKRLLLSLSCLLMSIVAWCALPASGKYYRIVNTGYTDYAMTENYANSTVTCTTIGNNKNYTQLWYYNNSVLQNVYTGHYLLAQTQASSIFKMGATGASISLTQESDGNIKIKAGGNTLHCDGSKNVVKWEPENEHSHWKFEEVTLTDEEINAARKEYQAFEKTENEHATQLSKLQSANYSALSTFFADNACTTLKTPYATMTDEALKAAIAGAGLPEAIQNIAVKVKNSWNDETDGSISAQFRVQDYQAYSAADRWRWRSEDGRGLNASQVNDMCNPTGIYTTGRDILFVFVEGDIPTGCELHLANADEGASGFGYSNYNSGTTLHKGINIIGAENTLNEYWVMYSVTDKTRKPADMPKLKIHIEGGHVMGYVNTQGKDEPTVNAEYERILKAANASAQASGADKCRLRLAVKGDYGMFYFQIMTYNRIWSDGSASLLANNPTVKTEYETEKWTSNYKYGFKIFKSIRFYDNVLRWEWSVMGFMKDIHDASASAPIDHLCGGEDLYPTYCNNLAYTIMGTKGGNPHSSTGYTHMPGVGAVESSYNGERQDFDTWCVGHESGHNNQGTINLESSMESSNNLFSGIITYLYGYRHSRGNTFSDNQKDSYNNVIFGWRDISITHRMYYNLYLYYHRAGNKPDFYPTLFTNLRHDPIRMGTGASYNGPEGSARTHNASTTWLHFYKKVCEAAQEDLTEYFRLWGFFIPVEKGYFGDYTSYYVTNTQADIDAAIAWVKSHNWPENKSIMFIEDRVLPVERTDPWATPGSLKPDNGGTMRDAAYLQSHFGNLGQFTEYIKGGAHNASEYTYTISGKTVSLTGEGGVGFLVYDEAGNIVYRSNSYRFDLPAELATKQLTIKAINADNTEVVAVNQTGTAQYREALASAIQEANKLTALSDGTGNKMGYYTTAQMQALQQLVATGNTILTNNDEAQYWNQYVAITDETTRILNEEGVQQVTLSGIYTIQSNRSKTRFLDGSAKLATSTSKGDQQQWAFVPTATAGQYYLQNLKSKKFLVANINSESKIANWTVDADSPSAASTFTLESAGSGSFYLKTNDVPKGNTYINCDPQGAIAVWSADAGSKWDITRIKDVEVYTDADINDLISKTEALIDQVCEYSSTNAPISGVQVTDKEAPYYLSTNAANGIDESHGLANVLSGINTYFSTAGATVKAKRFFTLDLGEGNEVESMKLSYRTAPNLHTMKPAQITVYTGKSTTGLSVLTTLTDLPTGTTAVDTYLSPTLVPAAPARVWRFRVESNNNPNPGTYPEVALARLFFYINTTTINLREGYETVDKTLVSKAKDQSTEATNALKGETSPLINYDIYTALSAAYNNLNDGVTTGIIGIQQPAGTEARQGIFDLSGRRLEKVVKGGIYIINGKKVMVK